MSNSRINLKNLNHLKKDTADKEMKVTFYYSLNFLWYLFINRSRMLNTKVSAFSSISTISVVLFIYTTYLIRNEKIFPAAEYRIRFNQAKLHIILTKYNDTNFA